MNYETSWWEISGETDWQTLPGGARMRRALFRPLGSTTEGVTADKLPVGALFAADRRGATPDQFPPAGPDGLSVVCVCIGSSPGHPHHWYIDYRASNCTLPDDKKHHCWVRHGTVGDRLTVDKNGLTCGAGAGSFFMDNKRWHGFLRNGVLVQA